MASDRHSAVDRGICVYCVLRCVCKYGDTTTTYIKGVRYPFGVIY